MSERPRHVAALLPALQFRDPRPEMLRGLSDAEWDQLLAFSDRAHLTLILGRACRDYMPGWVRERIDRNLADNTERGKRIQQAYGEIASALRKAGAEHLVLKGFSQWPDFVSDIHLRMQSDIDLYCPGDSLFRARDALLQVGYEPARSPENNVSDHIPPLIRRTGWEWRGNAFDPEMPPSVEFHHRLWNVSHTRIGPADFGAFWSRRIDRQMGSIRFPALHLIDSFDYSALHALRHLLYGGLLTSHIYELGFFLHHNAENETFWKVWLDRRDDSIRSMTAVSSLLATEWFACHLPDAVEEEIHGLPDTVPRWFRRFTDSPFIGMLQANKDALWLHISLIDSARDKCFVLGRRLFPLWVPSLNSRWVQEEEGKSGAERRRPLQKYITYFSWFVIRTFRHIRMLPSTLWHGLRMWSA